MTLQDDFTKLVEARNKFVFEVCKVLGVVWLVDKLNNLLRKIWKE